MREVATVAPALQTLGSIAILPYLVRSTMTSHATRNIMLGAAVVFAACAAPAKDTTPPPPPAITQAAIDQVVQDQVSALNAGDAAKAGAVYAADAVLVTAKGKAETQAAITAFWTEALKTPGAGKNLKVEMLKSGTSGDLAYTLATFSGGVTAPSGHTLAVSKRQADGSLKIIMQISIPDPPTKK
jgi:uncharacterized protein (TIGR02246 family)